MPRMLFRPLFSFSSAVAPVIDTFGEVSTFGTEVESGSAGSLPLRKNGMPDGVLRAALSKLERDRPGLVCVIAGADPCTAVTALDWLSVRSRCAFKDGD